MSWNCLYKLTDVIFGMSNNMNVAINSADFSGGRFFVPTGTIACSGLFSQKHGSTQSLIQIVFAPPKLHTKFFYSLFIGFVITQAWMCFSILSPKIKILFFEDFQLLVGDIDSFGTPLLSLITLPVFSPILVLILYKVALLVFVSIEGFSTQDWLGIGSLWSSATSTFFFNFSVTAWVL